jgi:hypothetical protein
MQYTVFCCSKLALLRLLLVVFFCCRCVIEDDEETALTEDVEAKAIETDTILLNMDIKNLILCVFSRTFDQTDLPFC